MIYRVRPCGGGSSEVFGRLVFFVGVSGIVSGRYTCLSVRLDSLFSSMTHHAFSAQPEDSQHM